MPDAQAHMQRLPPSANSSPAPRPSPPLQGRVACAAAAVCRSTSQRALGTVCVHPVCWHVKDPGLHATRRCLGTGVCPPLPGRLPARLSSPQARRRWVPAALARQTPWLAAQHGMQTHQQQQTSVYRLWSMRLPTSLVTLSRALICLASTSCVAWHAMQGPGQAPCLLMGVFLAPYKVTRSSLYSRPMPLS